MAYTELQVTSNFSFLRGASHAEELMEYAALLGYRQIAITDRNTLAGIVRAHVAAKKAGIQLIVGCRLELLNGPSLLAYPTNKEAYSRLCQLLSKGNLRAEKGDCHLYKEDVFEHANGMLFIVIPPEQLNEQFELDHSFKTALQQYKAVFKEQLYIAATRHYYAHDQKYLFRLAQLSKQLQIPLVATNDVHYHDQARRELQDIVTCIREKCTIYTAVPLTCQCGKVSETGSRNGKAFPAISRCHYENAGNSQCLSIQPRLPAI
jgi:error-prone DNA polymerase